MAPLGPCRGRRGGLRRCGKTGSLLLPEAWCSHADKAQLGSPGQEWWGLQAENPVEIRKKVIGYEGVRKNIYQHEIFMCSCTLAI